MAMLKLLSLNINGRKDGLERFKLFEFLKSENVDIMCLQESHTLLADEQLWRLTWRGRCFFSHLSLSCAGVIILINPKLDIDILDMCSIVDGRAIHLKVNFDGIIYNILNIYAPNDGKERIIFYNSCHRYVSTIDANSHLCILGDFNCTLNPKLDRGSGIETHKPSAECFSKIIRDFQLIDCYRHLYPDYLDYTWNNVRSYARLDRSYVSSF